MNILHNIDWKGWVVGLLIRQDGREPRSHIESARKRDVLPQANQHLLRDLGLSELEEPSEDSRR